MMFFPWLVVAWIAIDPIALQSLRFHRVTSWNSRSLQCTRPTFCNRKYKMQRNSALELPPHEVTADQETNEVGSTVGELSMIKYHSYKCLDFESLLDKLRDETVTKLGAQLVVNSSWADVESINRGYAMVEQLSSQLAMLPLRSSLDVLPVVKGIEMNLSPPDKEQLAKFSADIEELATLYRFFQSNSDKLTLFEQITKDLLLPQELVDKFQDSFDEELNLNPAKYPTIRVLQSDITSLEVRIINSIQSLLNRPEMREKVADNGYIEMEGRYCIMLKATYKRGTGIVHGSSNTGRTVYVEPFEVVEPTNELKALQVELRLEENKIFFEMCKAISMHRTAIRRSLTAAAQVDIIRAKALLGEKLLGVIPEVNNEGSMRCADAKHPLLVLRNLNTANKVVGNTIDLSENSAALVISGPNAGGKTIILKTCGLFALMARYAIPIPAKEGARVDVFNEVMADIGDMQSVSGDLSTFSGHLVICREILNEVHSSIAIAKQSSQTVHNLVLFDEIGTGTDPAQGAALAQSILEDLVSSGTRVMVTTHYSRIKELAAHDPRFRIAAMEFIDNRPTYRLRAGSVGESYALELAQRMELPGSVLERAHVLLDDESKRLIALQRRLEEETEEARRRQGIYDSKVKELADRERTIAEEYTKMENELKKIREGKVDEYLLDLKEKERELEVLMMQAREIVRRKQAAQVTTISQPSSTTPEENNSTTTTNNNSTLLTDGSLDDIQSALKKERVTTEKSIVIKSLDQLNAEPLLPGEPLDEGTTVIILEPGSLYGAKAIVATRNKGKGRVIVRVAGAEIKLERHLIAKQRFGIASLMTSEVEDKPMSAKDRRLLKMLNEELVDPDKIVQGNKAKRAQTTVGRVPRTSANTLDIRSAGSLPDAQSTTMSFFERMIDQSLDNISGGADSIPPIFVYINHGVQSPIKAKLRSWLKENPIVKRSRPAELQDGGDALTLVELNLEDL